MADNRDTLTLALEGGDVPLEDFSKAAAKLCALIEELSRGVGNPKSKISWVLGGLDLGSATLTVRGKSTDLERVDQVARRFISVGKDLEAGRRPAVSDKAVEYAHGILSLINGDITAVRFENYETEARIQSRVAEKPQVPMTLALGAVEGRIQAMSNRGLVRFTLYSAINDKPISCYMDQGSEDEVRDKWGHRAIVEGWVKRDARTGQPLTVRNIKTIEVLPEATPKAFLDIRGLVPSSLDGELPEITIRRLRDDAL